MGFKDDGLGVTMSTRNISVLSVFVTCGISAQILKVGISEVYCKKVLIYTNSLLYFAL